MTYTKDMVKTYTKLYRENIKLVKLSEKPTSGLFAQHNTEAALKSLSKFQSITEEFKTLSALSGDMSEHISSIEIGMFKLKEQLDANTQKTSSFFFQNLFGEPNIDKMKLQNKVKKLFKLMIADKSIYSKQAFEALVEIAIPSIIPLLNLTKDQIRKPDKMSAVMLVLKTAGESAVAPLIEVLNGNNYSRKEAATFALGIIGDAKAGEPFCNILQDLAPENWFSKIIAVRYIHRLLGDQAKAPVIQMIKEEEFIVIHKGARIIVNCLGEIGDEKHISLLFEKVLRNNSAALNIERLDPDITECIKKAVIKIRNRPKSS